MGIKDTIQTDLKDAMRSQDKQRVTSIRLITAAIKQVEVDERIEVDEERVLTILNKLVKRSADSITQFKEGNRDDLVEKEQFDLAVFKKYLPEPLDEQTLLKLIEDAISSVNATSMRDMSKVMAALRPNIQGRADMGKVSALIKEKLNT